MQKQKGSQNYFSQQSKKKDPLIFSGSLGITAERGGFEPPIRFWRIHAFQACLFSHSSISPSAFLSKSGCKGTDNNRYLQIFPLFFSLTGSGLSDSFAAFVVWLSCHVEKISINKNKQIYFFLFFSYFSLLIFYHKKPARFGWKPIPSEARVTRDEVSGL